MLQNYNYPMDDTRFSGILGDDYKLLKYAYPHHDEFQQSVAEQIHKHVSSLDIKNPIILEGGCGSGVTSLFILQTNKNIHLLGIDNEQKMLNQAKTILQDYSTNIEFINNDLLSELQKRESSSVDVFVAVWTLHNLKPDYRSLVFAEVYRVLKSNELFISGDKYALDNEKEHKKQLEAQLDRFRSFENKDLAEAWVKHNMEDDTIKMKESDQHSILNNLGFKSVVTTYRKDMEVIIMGIKPSINN